MKKKYMNVSQKKRGRERERDREERMQ